MSDFVENKSFGVLRGGINKEKPSVDEISQGQLAVNYRKGHEALFTKNSNGEIVQINGAGGESNFIIYRDSNHDEDGIFPDKQALYDSLRDHIKRGELLFEPEEGKMCVAIVRNEDNGELETYPIISPEPSHDSIVDPVKTKRANQIKNHPAPYGGNKIVVRRHMRIDPWVNLPYYFQNGICIFRERFSSSGSDKVYTFKYDSSLLQFHDILTYHIMSDVDVKVEDIDEHGCDKQVVITSNNNFTQWVMIRFDMGGYNVFEAMHRIYEYRYNKEGNCFWLNRNNVKLANISDDEYRTRETLSPYLKLEWANYISGGNDYGSPNDNELHKPKLVNIRPSLWRGVIDCLEEKIYPNREPGRYKIFLQNVFGHDWPKPRYMIRSKMRNHIPNYSEADFKKVQQECIIPEINGGKILVHYNSSLIRGLVNEFDIDLTTEFLKLVFKTKTRPCSDIKIVHICLDELDLTKNYTEYEASDFSVFSGIQNVFSQYEIYESETICVNDENIASKYFGTLSQFKARKTNRWAHKLSGWHWCKHRKDFHIFDSNRRYGGNKSYSLLLYKKHRGVLSVEPCHLSVIRTNPLKEAPAETPNYLTFNITESGDINYFKQGGGPKRELEYRKSSDGGTTWGEWVAINPDTNSSEKIYVDADDKIQFRARFENYGSLTSGNYTGFWNSTARFNISGNIMSLIGYDDFENLDSITSSYVFNNLFRDCKGIIDARSLKLPATTLADYCYYNMFYGCTGLTSAPSILPATTLEEACYSSMFNGCSSLTTAPALPAITLAERCYSSMFNGCYSLTTLPELPATTLADFCYQNMFSNCTGLTTAPDLPATVLTKNCYMYMFRNCTNLNYIKCLATDITAEYCTIGWVQNVQTSSGTFVKNTNMYDWSTGNNGIPSGWDVRDDF